MRLLKYTLNKHVCLLTDVFKLIKFKLHQFELDACLPALSIQIAKFKFCQYQLRAVSSALMFAKVTHSGICKSGFSKIEGGSDM